MYSLYFKLSGTKGYKQSKMLFNAKLLKRCIHTFPKTHITKLKQIIKDFEMHLAIPVSAQIRYANHAY